jgi:hypothetical protein
MAARLWKFFITGYGITSVGNDVYELNATSTGSTTEQGTCGRLKCSFYNVIIFCSSMPHTPEGHLQPARFSINTTFKLSSDLSTGTRNTIFSSRRSFLVSA